MSTNNLKQEALDKDGGCQSTEDGLKPDELLTSEKHEQQRKTESEESFAGEKCFDDTLTDFEKLFFSCEKLAQKNHHVINEAQDDSTADEEASGLREKIESTRYLWGADSGQPTNEHLWACERTRPMHFDWERILKNTSCIDGIEEWAERLTIPDVPDNRVKLLYASISGEMRKVELSALVENSLLQTDQKLSSILIQINAKKYLERMNILRNNVETIEDVLSLLNDSSVEAKHRNAILEQLARTLVQTSLKELLEFSHSRNLVLISISALIDSEFRTEAFEIVKVLMFHAAQKETSPNRASLLADIIERCNSEELLWLTRNILTLYSESELISTSAVYDLVKQNILRKANALKCRSSSEWQDIHLRLHRNTTDQEALKVGKKTHKI